MRPELAPGPGVRATGSLSVFDELSEGTEQLFPVRALKDTGRCGVDPVRPRESWVEKLHQPLEHQGIHRPGELRDHQSLFRMKTDATDIPGGGNDEEMLKAYHDALARLDLRIETTAGIAVPTDWIDIDDFSVELGADDEEAFQITVHMPDLDALEAEHLLQAKRAADEWW